jgi:hypothetical protein
LEKLYELPKYDLAHIWNDDKSRAQARRGGYIRRNNNQERI